MAQTMTTQRSSDTDDRLLEFVRTRVDTFVKWDLVRFFHDNPYAADTAENIARFAGRDARSVEAELKELVNSGVLESSLAGSTRIFRYVKDQEIRELIRTFVIACDDRDFRVRAINLVIEGLQ